MVKIALALGGENDPANRGPDDERVAGWCWLCRRKPGTRMQRHHLVPRSKGGRVTVPVHPICHRAIHANFTNVELVRTGGDHAALVANAAVARFLAWIADRPPDFHAPTRGRR